MNVDTLWESYRSWLLTKRVRLKRKTLTKLMKTLHEIDYKVLVKMDRNRRDDGLIQREYFLSDFKLAVPEEFVEEFLNIPCSVLEVLIALSVRMDYEWVGTPGDPRPDLIFLDMLKNLRILKDDRAFSKRFESEVIDRVNFWIDRKFDFNGEGSIFPLMLNKYRIDQREIELWRQMTAYISERYKTS